MLSDVQLEQFNRQGYLVVENLIDQAAVEAVKAEYALLMDQLYAEWFKKGWVKTPPDGLDFWGKLDNSFRAGFDWYQPLDISLPHSDISEDTPLHIGPAVFDMATHKNILDVMEQLIGPEITSNPIQHVRIKPPQSAVCTDEVRAHIVATDWHQDKGVTLEEADHTDFITVWLAITDATIENGCLQVASGNYQELIPHCSKTTQVGIAERFLSRGVPTPVPVKAGGAVIFHPLTPHGSLINKSDGYRWSFDLRYNVTGQPTGRSHFPEFIARSRSDPQRELHDWRAWKHMWEETRCNLSSRPHIPQHRWDSEGSYCA